MKQIIVPDASVLLKWVFDSPDEQDRNKALNVLTSWLDGHIEIILPKLWVFEVGNVLALKRPKMAPEIMEVFIGYNFTELDITVDLCKETFSLMKKYNVTFYDGVYHAVAISKNGTFLTADKTYCRKVGDMKNILHLSKF